MVTKPVPAWERWLQSERGREFAYRWARWGVVLLNVFIVIGCVLFILFLLAR